MAGTLGNLNIELSADTAKFMSDMGRAAYMVESSIKKMQRSFGALQAAAAGLGVALGTGIFVSGIKNVINQADELGKLSQKVGVTVENLSALKYAAELSDVSMEGLTIGLKKLATNMFEASSGGEEALRIFRGLGVEFQSSPGKLLATDEVLLRLADKFSKMEDGAAKSALAVKLFGKNGLELIPFLNQGRDGVQRLTEELEKLGGKMTGEMAKSAEQFNDNLKSLSVASNALKIEIGNKALPALSEITEAMKEAAKESGLLAAAWVGLGGVAANLVRTSDAEKLRDVQDKINRLQFQMTPNNPANPALQRQMGALIAERLELGKRLSGTGFFGDEKPKPQPKIVPDASQFGNEKALKTAKETLDVGKQWAEDQEEWNKIMSEAAQLTDDFYRRIREGDQKIEDERMKAWLEFIDREREQEEIQARLAAGFDENGNKIKDNLKEQTNLARELGLTFTSAFEDAIVKGMQFSDILKGLAADLARLAIRKTITEPLGAAASSFFGNALGSFFGAQTPAIHTAAGGPVSPSLRLVGEHGPELFVPQSAGTIVPNSAMGVSVVQNIHFEASTPAAVRAAVFESAPAIAEMAAARVNEKRRRGA